VILDGIRSILWIEGADVGFAFVRVAIFVVFASEVVIKEEVHAKEEPGRQKPHDREDDERLLLVLPLAVSLGHELLERRGLL
jgi:Na+-transporting methylmalonyl-CoA/oxaloacetate decarboxylase gamma subunit